MIRGILLASAILVVQDVSDRFRPAAPTDKGWTLYGPAETEDGAELAVGIRRIERRWDGPKAGWFEIKSDVTHLRTVADAAHRKFEALLRAGPTGRYHVQVSTDTQVIHVGEAAFGSTESLFQKGPGHIKEFLDLITETIDYLNEIERYLKSPEEANQKAKESFLRRVGDTVKRVDRLLDETDFTGSIRQLQEVLLHVRNVQIWKFDKLPPPAQNDSAVNKKHVFIEPELTLADVKRQLEAIRTRFSSEIRVSLALIVHRLFVQSDGDERALGALRTIARVGSKFAEAAPDPDKELIRLLDLAADRQTAPAEIRDQLKQYGQALLLK